MSECDLNGTWKFIPDPMQRGIRQQWWKNSRDPSQIFPCWDMDGLWDIQVPGTWNCLIPKLTWYEGHACYVREFSLENIPDNTEAYLCFDGANYAAEVWLNGVWVGKHACGYSPFQFRVTPLLRATNRVMVYVENIRQDDRVPGMIFDWANDGGLIRPVKLIFVPERHIENFSVHTTLAGDEAQIRVQAWFTSRDVHTHETIRVAFPELGLCAEQSVAPGEKTALTFQVPRAALQLWQPGAPTLYAIEVSCGADTVCDEIGLREIRTQGRGILLNGERIQLWGVCLHAEFKEMGRTDTPELLDELFARLHELGANFVRCAHYPYSEAFVRQADREGFLLWEEVPAYWQPRMPEPAVKSLAFQMMGEMIDRDLNRASVIIWSVSNECAWKNPESDIGDNYHYGIECAHYVRSLDPSRLISSAEGQVVMSDTPWSPADVDQFRYSGADHRSWRPSLPDAYFDAMDVIAMNCYVGAFGHEPVESLEDALAVFYPYNKPVMMSEFGCVSRRGDTREDLTVGGERRHVDVVRRAYEVFARTPWMSGAAIWNFLDMRTPLHWEDFVPGGARGLYGIVDKDWQPKQAFYVVQEYCRRFLGTHAATATEEENCLSSSRR
ncbi:MAG TPA: glycoside hydrolase family 2 TIM barrel-domain containing protein [Armatimonadota bacterium]